MKVGINVGGCKISIGTYFGESPHPEYEDEIPTTRDFDFDTAAIIDYLRWLWNEYEPIDGIGIAAAGKVDPNRSMLIGAGELTPWIGKPLRDRLVSAFDCWVAVGNDAEGEGLAEARCNPAVLDKDFVYVCLGTGIGGCRIARRCRRTFAFPAEPGHTNVRPGQHRRRHKCGQWDCLELYAGGEGLKARFQVESAKYLTMRQWRLVFKDLGRGLSGLMLAHPDAETLVLGGGMTEKDAFLVDGVREALGDALLVIAPPKVISSVFPATSFAGRVLLDLSS